MGKLQTSDSGISESSVSSGIEGVTEPPPSQPENINVIILRINTAKIILFFILISS